VQFKRRAVKCISKTIWWMREQTALPSRQQQPGGQLCRSCDCLNKSVVDSTINLVFLLFASEQMQLYVMAELKRESNKVSRTPLPRSRASKQHSLQNATFDTFPQTVKIYVHDTEPYSCWICLLFFLCSRLTTYHFIELMACKVCSASHHHILYFVPSLQNIDVHPFCT